MADRYDDQEEKQDSFEFDDSGEAVAYISLDQARVLAMRSARTEPGEYGRFTRSPMAFEVEEETETEDHYVVTLLYRPQGEFSGESGREQFFIEKDGTVAHRQVLSLPKPAATGRSISGVLVGIVLVLVVIGGAAGVMIATGVLGGPDDEPALAVIPGSTPGADGRTKTQPAPTATAAPRPPPRPAPTAAPVVVAPPTVTPPPAPTPAPVPVRPIPAPVVVPPATPIRVISTVVPPRVPPPGAVSIRPTATAVAASVVRALPTATPAPIGPEVNVAMARARVPAFGFSFEYPAEWEVVAESSGEFAAEAPGGGLAVHAEGEEFEGTAEELATDFADTLSYVDAFVVVSSADQTLRLGGQASRVTMQARLVEYRFWDEKGVPGIGYAALTIRPGSDRRIGILIQYLAPAGRADLAKRLFTRTLDSIRIFRPEAQETAGEFTFEGEVVSVTGVAADATLELYEDQGELTGYIDIAPPHTGSGDLLGQLDEDYIVFTVSFTEEGATYQCVYEGTVWEQASGASGDYVCIDALANIIDTGAWSVSQ